MKKLFVSLVLLVVCVGCCGGPVDLTPKYNVTVFSGGTIVARYTDCYDYMRNPNSYTLYTTSGRITVTGTITIEPITKPKLEVESK